jgi:outer membrane protein TolC
MLSLGYARKRMSSERWPMYDVGLEQPLPRWGERDAARAMAASTTRLGEADLAGAVAELAADLATALTELDDLGAKLGEAEAEERRLTALATALDARLASGDAKVLDRLALDTRRERLHLRLDDLRRQVADRGTMIRGRLGLPPTAALPPFAAPLPEIIDPAHTPAALAAEARRQEALAGLLDARAMGNPETAIGVRAEREAADNGNEDTIGVTVSISLPIARGAIAANEDAAHARLHAAEQAAEAARWRTTSAIETARRALAQAEHSAHLAETLLTRADAEGRALTAALASGGAEVTALLDLYDRLAELRVQVIEARTSARQAQAALWLHVVPALPAPATDATP